METEGTKRTLKKREQADILEEWDRIDHPKMYHPVEKEFTSIGYYEQSTQTDNKSECDKISIEIKEMRDELKILSEMVISMIKEIKEIKILGEREKNRYVRSHIPFRFIPEHTVYPLVYNF